jgi:hypothetical protein
MIGARSTSSNFNYKKASQVSCAAKKCFDYLEYNERVDFKDGKFETSVAHILGVFSSIISYQESITILCLNGH